MTAAAFSYEPSEHRPLAQRAWRLAAVVGLHAGLIACMMHAQMTTMVEPVPLRMEVRAIEIPPSSPPEVATPVTAPPRPLPTVAQPVIRRPPAPAPMPVLAAAPSAEPAPPTFTAAPAPAIPVKEVAQPPAPPSAPSAPLAPPAPVAEQGPRFDADYLQNPAPVYPSLSRRKREEGQVLLQVRVGATGSPEQIQIKQGSGFPRLDEAAVNTVQRWRFVPARRGDEAVTASVIVPIIFRLEG